MTEQPVALLTEETERRLEVLRRGIKRAAGFQLYVVLARDLARAELLRRLGVWSGAGGFPDLRFFPEGAPGVLAVDRFLAAQDEEDAPAGAVIPDGAAFIDAEGGGPLANLNVSRDVLDKMIRGPLLLVLPPEREGDLARRAADLFDVRSGTILVETRSLEPEPRRIAEIAAEHADEGPSRSPVLLQADAARLRALGEGEDISLGALVDAWVRLGHQLLRAGETAEAAEAARLAQQFAERANYRSGLAQSIILASLVAKASGDIVRAEALTTEFLAAFTHHRAPSERGGLVSSADLHALYTALVSAGLAGRRQALLAGLDPAFVASLPVVPDPAAQTLMDLGTLSQAGTLADGTVPLAVTLKNAVMLASRRPEAKVFRRLLGSVAPHRVSVPVPVQISIARLPATGGDLFGREAELAWLDACWAERAHVAIVVAWGGVGKSALVNTWLAEMRDAGWRGAERVYGWSFYSQGTDRLTSSDEFVDAALRWFGDGEPEKGSPWDKGERLAALVRRERTILVLDGIEPLQWGPGVQTGRFKDPALEALVKELGAQNNGLCLLTTRIALTDLDALAGDKVRAEDLGRLSAAAGAELLAARGAKGTVEELRAAAEEYDGHGLALTLLGSYLEDVAEGDIQRRKEIGPLLVDERQGGHARRVMAAYELWLGKPEVAILRMIGLCDRPVEPEEIVALRADPPVVGLTDALAGVDKRAWNKAVARLRNARLLSVEEDKRLDAHPLVREHFGERLKQEQPEAWLEGHWRLYEHLRATAKELPETLEEMAPLYAAVVHGCAAGKNQEALDEVYWKRIMRQDEYFSTRKLGAFGGEVAVLSAFFAPPWEQLTPGLTEADQAFVLNCAGYALRAVGRLPEAAGLLRLGLERCIALEDWKQAAASASNLSELLQAHGELSDAVAQARKSVELADKGGDAFLRMYNRAMLAAALHAMGLWEQAAAQLEEAERMQKARQPAYPLLYSLQGFQYCDLLLDQGRHADAQERAAQALVIAEHNRWLLLIALDQLSLGRAHLLAAQRDPSADLALAATHLGQAVDALRRTGQQDYVPLGLLARAALHTHTRDFARARHDLDGALDLATRCGFHLHEADAHLGHAHLALAESHRDAALSHLATARALITATGYHRRDGDLAELEVEAAAMVKTARPPEPLAAPPEVPRPPRPGPMPEKPTTTQPVDLSIIIALEEEIGELLHLAGEHTSHDGGGMISFLFVRDKYRCAVTLVGKMGEMDAATVTQRHIAWFDPLSVVSIGISGSVHQDLHVGDVFVPRQVVQYVQDGKATQKKRRGYVTVPGPPVREVDHQLLTAAVGFHLRHQETHARWQKDASANLTALVVKAERDRLFAVDFVRKKPLIRTDGHEATGPVVAGSTAFSDWIRSHDRNVKAIDMESAAVVRVAQARNDPRRALVIRGISDYADPRKKELDAIGKGGLRRYAMRNAVRFLFALLEQGALPSRPR